MENKTNDEWAALVMTQVDNIYRLETALASAHSHIDSLTLELASRQRLADSFVAPSVTVDTPEMVRYTPYMRGREGNEHASMTADKDGQYVKHDDALSHTARAVAAAVEKERASEMDTIRDRDQYHEWADKLADAIAKYFGRDIGEHSNVNCPWDEALDVIEEAEPIAAQPVAGELPPSRFGSPDLQAMIINRAAQPVQQPAAE